MSQGCLGWSPALLTSPLVSWPCRPCCYRPWGSGLSPEPGWELASGHHVTKRMPSPPPRCPRSRTALHPCPCSHRVPDLGCPHSSHRDTSASLVPHSGAHNSPGADSEGPDGPAPFQVTLVLHSKAQSLLPRWSQEWQLVAVRVQERKLPLTVRHCLKSRVVTWEAYPVLSATGSWRYGSIQMSFKKTQKLRGVGFGR